MTHHIDREADPNPLPGSFPAFLIQVEHCYASLIRHAPLIQMGLGGKLLYVGELDEGGRALMVAANIAGAASLAATAGQDAQKQAIREGVADFLVTTLDEALRILKNEVRKGQPVAVCVAGLPETMESEMLERGVLPDLVRDPGVNGTADRTVNFGGGPALVRPVDPAQDESLLRWSVDQAPARWLPRLDAIAADYLAEDEGVSAQIARRWLHMAPRYLGRLAGNLRVLRCSSSAAKGIAERVRASVQSGGIAVPVRIEIVSPLSS